MSAYQAYLGLIKAVKLSRIKAAASNLANEQFEIVRNMPYSDVGIVGGLPVGNIPYAQNLTRDQYGFTVTATVRSIDQSFDGTIGGNPNDLSPADNKLVEFAVSCATCENFAPMVFTTTVAPKNLETASTNGALFVRVFDANGVAVVGAAVTVRNDSLSPAILINDTTNSQGMLQIVDAPPGVGVYNISVTKTGYSTDSTLPVTVGNPTPSKPFGTVALQQVTQISFAIDRTSTVNFSSRTLNCNAVPSIDFSLAGSKLIGTNPDLYKYDEDLQTNGSGLLSLTNVEWDSYSLSFSDASFDLIGTNPLLAFNVSPNSVLDAQLIVAPKNPRTLVVVVKDSSLLLPLADASVRLYKTGYDETLVTGRGFLNQTDWSGGAGQQQFTDTNEYWSSDGGVNTGEFGGEIRLTEVLGDYTSDGYLESSVFDTGSASSFYNIALEPQDQPPLTGSNSIRLQLASGNDPATTTWDFKGPDGTVSTYYDMSNLNVASVHTNDRYIKYKIFLHTDNDAVTPALSDISLTYTSSCIPPGQTAFQGLSSGTYTLEVSRTGYQTQSVNVSTGSDWQKQEILLIPEP